MESISKKLRRQLIEQVLALDDDPIAKVRQLIRMGVDEEDATNIVERYQIGQRSVVYYEQLPLGVDTSELL